MASAHLRLLFCSSPFSVMVIVVKATNIAWKQHEKRTAAFLTYQHEDDDSWIISSHRAETINAQPLVTISHKPRITADHQRDLAKKTLKTAI